MFKVRYLGVLGFLFTTLFGGELQAPYNSLTEIYPFVNHGWYQNHQQLRALIKERNIQTIIEIGVWVGQSTIDLARHLPPNGKIYAVDHFLGSSEHQPGNGAWHPCLAHLYEQFLSNVIHAGLTDKIIPIRMASLEAAQFLSDVRPDMVYIDASHDTEAVYKDLCSWFPFVKGRGVLCGDDWEWGSVREAVCRFAEQHHLAISATKNFWRLVE